MRVWAAAFIVLAGAAEANSPEPSRETLAAIASTCTAQGAFGHHFGVPIREQGEGIPPFIVEAPSRQGAHKEWVEITASASYARAPMSQEDREYLAKWVYEQLAARIAARRLAHRHDRSDGTTFVDPLFVLDLSRDGTTVRLSCLKASGHTP